MKETIGFIGNGFVNGAVISHFKDFFNIEVYDVLKERRTVESIKDLMKKTKILFLAVPTPINEKEECYLDHIFDIYKEVDKYNDNHHVILKSSIQPGTTEYLLNNFKVNTVFNPEFLREKSHIEDFKNQEFIILSGNDVSEAERIYKICFPETKIYKTAAKTAEMTKFFINTYLATKVSFCNEINSICKKMDVDYNDVIELALLDDRIGSSHTKVPGDATEKAKHGYGFGGSCFPQNLCILIDLANKLDVDVRILKAVKTRNDTLDRPEKDWLIKGKTIV